METLQELFTTYKNRDYKKQIYNTSAYINYSNAVTKQSNKLDISQFTIGNKIHYMMNTMIGSFMYNAKVIDKTDNIITIQPCGKAWKNKSLILNNGESAYIAKGWL
jgi:hypothetical protein